MKKALARFMALLLILGIITSASASSSRESMAEDKSGAVVNYSLPQLRELAISILKADFYMEADSGTWDCVSIVKETPLYSIDGRLIAYCFDLSCEEQQAYIIVCANSSAYPVLQFAPHAISPYYDLDSESVSVYGGVGQYYVEAYEGSKLLNLTSSEVEERTECIQIAMSGNASDDLYGTDYYDIAMQYLNSDFNSNARAVSYGYRNLISVPQYQWEFGCSPTAMAMVLAYGYGSLFPTASDLIRVLAHNMETDAWDGATYLNRIPSGAMTTLIEQHKTYTSIGYASADWLGYPNTGSAYNTAEAYQNEITNSRPVLITMNGANGTSDIYDKGFGDHSVTGVGYNFTANASYVIVHTTQVADGDVLVPLSASAMGDYAWCFVVP